MLRHAGKRQSSICSLGSLLSYPHLPQESCIGNSPLACQLPYFSTMSISLNTRRASFAPRWHWLTRRTRRLFCSSTNFDHDRAARARTSEAEDLVDHMRWSKGGGVVHKLALVDPLAVVEAGAVVHAHAQVGPHSHICSGSVVGPYVIVGSSTTLWYNVSLQNCSIGDSCTIHNCACVGQDGFGFFVDETGQMVKKPQTLRVLVGDHVEIGANTCIDRGSWRDTVIGDHTKIDNQVQIGHNVVIGRCAMLCGQVGIGGSCTLGDYVVVGGKAGVADHLSIVSKVRIAAMSGVTGNITEPGDYAGFPAVKIREWRRSIITVRKLGRLQSSDSSLWGIIAK